MERKAPTHQRIIMEIFPENGRFTNCTIDLVSQLTDACFQEMEHRMEHIRTRLHDNPLGFISQEMLYLSTDKLPL